MVHAQECHGYTHYASTKYGDAYYGLKIAKASTVPNVPDHSPSPRPRPRPRPSPSPGTSPIPMPTTSRPLALSLSLSLTRLLVYLVPCWPLGTWLEVPKTWTVAVWLAYDQNVA